MISFRIYIYIYIYINPPHAIKLQADALNIEAAVALTKIPPEINEASYERGTPP